MRYKDQEFARREQCILDSATQLFMEQTWEKVTVAEIADRSGIGKGTVYKHFASKEEILARLVVDFERECLQLYRRIAEDSPPLVAIRKIVRTAFDLILDSPVQAQLHLFCGRPDFQERLRPQCRSTYAELELEYFTLFNDILARAIRAGQLPEQPVEPLFLGLLAAFEGAMVRLSSGVLMASKELSRATYLESITDFMLAGILGMQHTAGMHGTFGNKESIQIGNAGLDLDQTAVRQKL